MTVRELANIVPRTRAGSRGAVTTVAEAPTGVGGRSVARWLGMAKQVDERRGRRSSQPSRTQHERTYMIELGQRLRMVREERGLTQQEVARSAGVATDMVSRLENGHYTSPGLRTMLRIAEGMGISVAALLPDVPAVSYSTPEAALKARLAALLQRFDHEDLELLVDLAQTIANRYAQ